MQYDALLLVSFGGPEGRDDVFPFLENVLRGKNVPRERMMEVAEHYYHFDGVSPINLQNRELIAALEMELKNHQIDLPVYWGNRNWHPLLTDTIAKIKDDGHERILTFMTSAYSSYSGCRQYREDVSKACDELGVEFSAIDKLRVFYNHPGFVLPMAERVNDALGEFENQDDVRILFTAHSIPLSMAGGCGYQTQLEEACKLVANELDHSAWELVYQSRSGPPTQPWLVPDVCDRIEELHETGELSKLIVVPIGFISDHLEVLFDLDEEAAQLCEEKNIQMVRAKTVGTHPQFVSMIRELIEERLDPSTDKRSLGSFGANHDVCPVDCCLPGSRPRPQ